MTSIKQNRQQQLKNQSLIYKQFVHAVFNHHSFIFATWIYCHLKDGCTVKSSIIVPWFRMSLSSFCPLMQSWFYSGRWVQNNYWCHLVNPAILLDELFQSKWCKEKRIIAEFVGLSEVAEASALELLPYVMLHHFFRPLTSQNKSKDA